MGAVRMRIIFFIRNSVSQLKERLDNWCIDGRIYVNQRHATSLTIALCKLHNYCIDNNDTIIQALASDRVHGLESGGIVQQFNTLGEPLCDNGFLDNGLRDSEETREMTRQITRSTILPRNLMLEKIIVNDLHRPPITRPS